MGRWAVIWPALAALAALAIARLPLPAAAALIVLPVALLLTVIYPLFGLGLALLLGPFGALENVVLGNSLLDSGQLALLLALAAWIGSGLARRRLNIPQTSVNVPLALFILVALFSLIDAPSIPLGLVELLKWWEIALIVWLIGDAAADPAHQPRGYPAVARAVMAMLLLAGVVQAAIGIWQFGLRGHGPEHFLVLDRFYRAYGTFEQPNPFGGFMSLTAFPALGLVVGLVMSRLRRQRGENWGGSFIPPGLWFAFAFVVAVTASLALVLSWSRGAWLGFMAGVAVLVLFSATRIWRGLGFMAVAVIVLAGGIGLGASAGFGPALAVADRLGGFREEFTAGDVRGVDINDANYAVVERLAHWQAALDMARDDLWTGVGFGNYEAAYPRYALINFPDPLGHAHNYYINLLAEVGLPGLLVYLWLWLIIVAQTIRLGRRLAWPERGVAVGLLAAWGALAVHHLVDKLYVNNIYVHLGVMIGLLQLLAWPGFWTGARVADAGAVGDIRSQTPD
jgi:O-antigen ligase